MYRSQQVLRTVNDQLAEAWIMAARKVGPFDLYVDCVHFFVLFFLLFLQRCVGGIKGVVASRSFVYVTRCVVKRRRTDGEDDRRTDTYTDMIMKWRHIQFGLVCIIYRV